ncbi:MAG: hypothetical protein Q9170_001393 [Blastenia crenularia]
MDPPVTKYRASCDGCYLAKVKCTKERPFCPRCKNLGLECKYSPSQRAGKSRRATYQTLGISKAPEWPSKKHNNVTEVSSKPASILPATIDTHPQQRRGARSDFHSISGSPHLSRSETEISVNSPDGAASMLQDLDDINFLTPWRDYLPNLDKEQSLFRCPNDLVGFSDATTTTNTTTTSPVSTSASHFSKDPDLMQMTAFPITSGCDCVSSLAQTLEAMQNPSTHPKNPPPALEVILGDSKDVVTRGEALLHCTCSDDSTPIMLFTALAAKYLSFYGSTTCSLDSSPEQYHPSDFMPPSSSGSTTTTSLMPTTSSSPSRVKIGTYTLDAEGEERLRVKIMMMELQKLGALLSKFRAKFSSLPVGYEGHTYETVLDFLTTRLREATDRLRRQKKRLKGEVV